MTVARPSTSGPRTARSRPRSSRTASSSSPAQVRRRKGRLGAVARFNPDGRLDPTFDGDGKKLLPLGTLEEVRSVIIQRDDRIVLAGRGRIDGNPSMAVTRLTPDGGNDGTTFTPVTFGSGLEAAAAALGPDGRIVFAGTDFLGGSRARIVLARYDVDGTLDDTFGSVGKVVYDTGGSDQAASVLVRADGKIVVAGSSATLRAPSMEAIRFNRDGGPDASFGSGGRGMPEFDGASAGVAAALQPDGKIVLAGTAVPPYTVALARLGADGALDRSVRVRRHDHGRLRQRRQRVRPRAAARREAARRWPDYRSAPCSPG